jgi:hypothetical protein
MSVKVLIEVSKEDVEMLAQTIEYTKDDGLKEFAERVLRQTDISTDYAIHNAQEVAKVNPFSLS